MRSHFVCFALMLVALSTGCAKTLTVRIARPAIIDIGEHGGSLSVGNVSASAGELEAQIEPLRVEIRQGVLEANAPRAQWRESGGAVRIDATIEDGHFRQSTDQRPYCQNVDENGTSRRDCQTENIRDGQASLTILFTLTRADGTQIFSDVFRASVSERTTAIAIGAPVIDEEELYARARRKILTSLLHILAPWVQTDTIEFDDCPAPTQTECDAAYLHFEAGRYAEAIAQYQQALATLAAQRYDDRERLANVHMWMGRALEFEGQTDLAVQSLQEALRLHPSLANRSALMAMRERVAHMHELRGEHEEPSESAP